MGRITQRLIFAAMLSIAFYSLTLYWYKSTGKKNENQSNIKPIAFITQVFDEAQRRPTSRTIWQLLDIGEPIYPGEAIKTAEKGEVRIQFAESDRYIDVEPESMIVISQSKNEISLDLMDGSLFVSQGEGKESDASLTLQSDKGKIDLSKATASLSKSESKDIQLQVLKGKAQMESGGKVQELESGKSGVLKKQGAQIEEPVAIKILSPDLEKPTYINPENLDFIRFAWDGAPKDSHVQIQLGVQRKQLQLITETKTKSEKELFHKLPPGKYYWKLIASQGEGKTQIESPIYRLNIEPKYAPIPLFPEPYTLITQEKFPAPITMKWVLPEQSKSVYIEISKEPNLKTKLFTKNFIDQDQFVQNFDKGDYYWRLSTQYPGISKTISSKVYKFTISEKQKSAPPKIVIEWKNKNPLEVQQFVKDPILSLNWNTEQIDQVHLWKIKIASREEDLQKTPLIAKDTETLFLETPIEKPGRYIAQVDALDKNYKTIATSTLKTVEVQLLPLLPAIQFLPKDGDLKTDDTGFLNINWTPISEAQKYQITLYNKDGEKISAKMYQGTQTTINNMLPGTYKIDVVAIDKHGREGEKAPARTILVPTMSALKAPKVKGVKIK